MSTTYKSHDGESMIIVCNCGNCEHQARLWHDEEDDVFFIEIHLRAWENIFRRALVAIKYIFGYKSRFGDWDEIIVNRDSAEDIVKYLQSEAANE